MIMKKKLFAAFAGMCIVSSLMAITANKGKTDRLINLSDTTIKPAETTKVSKFVIKKQFTDTTSKPSDTTKVPKMYFVKN